MRVMFSIVALSLVLVFLRAWLDNGSSLHH